MVKNTVFLEIAFIGEEHRISFEITCIRKEHRVSLDISPRLLSSEPVPRRNKGSLLSSTISWKIIRRKLNRTLNLKFADTRVLRDSESIKGVYTGRNEERVASSAAMDINRDAIRETSPFVGHQSHQNSQSL